MPGHAIRRLAAAVVTVGALTSVLAGARLAGGGTTSLVAAGRPASDVHSTGQASPIQHVIIIMQENRSFDQYFGTYPGADGIPMNAQGTPTVPCNPDPRFTPPKCALPYHDSSDLNYGGRHRYSDAITDINGGSMTGFAIDAWTFCQKAPVWNPACLNRSLPFDVMGYHNQQEIPNYWAYAQNFVLQDHMFAPSLSFSPPEHIYMVSGWTANNCIPNVPTSCVNTIDNPDYLVDFGNSPARNQKRPVYSWTDVTYLLHQAGVSWKYYIGDGTLPDCLNGEPVCSPPAQGPNGSISAWNPLPFFDTVREDCQQGNIQSASQFQQDVTNGTLPNVSWIVPDQLHSEHPTGTVSDGQAWVTNIVNAIMQSPQWNSTAVFVAWDDWGGFYDHATPVAVDQNGYGLRVPGLVISPYARSGYIDHQTLSFDAYLKFIEDIFLGGQRLDPTTDGRPDNRIDVRENMPQLGNLMSDFNFSQTPNPPLVLTPYPNGTPTPTTTATNPPTTPTDTPIPVQPTVCTGTYTPTPAPSTPTATNTPIPAPSIILNPTSGSYTRTVTITGTKFSVGEPVNVYFDQSSTPPLTTVTSDSAGSFVSTFAVPSASDGTHHVLAAGQMSHLAASAPFTVTPRLFLSASSGPAGTSTILTGTGFGSRETIKALWGGRQPLYLGSTITNAAGAFGPDAGHQITVTVPASPTGVYSVIGIGQASQVSASVPFTITASMSMSSHPRPGGSSRGAVCRDPLQSGQTLGTPAAACESAVPLAIVEGTRQDNPDVAVQPCKPRRPAHCPAHAGPSG